MWLSGKETACNARDPGLTPGREDPLEKEMATQSSILHGKSCGQRSLVGYSPWGHKRVGHDLVTKQNNNYCYLWASQLALMVKNQVANVGDIRDAGLIPGSGRSRGGGHGNPLQYSCLENPMDRGAWRATVRRLQRVGHKWSNWADTHGFMPNDRNYHRPINHTFLMF